MFQTYSELKSVFFRLFSNFFGIDLEMATPVKKHECTRIRVLQFGDKL